MPVRRPCCPVTSVRVPFRLEGFMRLNEPNGTRNGFRAQCDGGSQTINEIWRLRTREPLVAAPQMAPCARECQDVLIR